MGTVKSHSMCRCLTLYLCSSALQLCCFGQGLAQEFRQPLSVPEAADVVTESPFMPLATDELPPRRSHSRRDLTEITERAPRSTKEIEAFAESLAGNDARIKVVVGQGRLLTLRSDLVQPGQTSPLIAVGDPTIVDFQIIDNRHLRVMGQRIGVTDLAIFTSDQESYSFEVSVVADLSLLEAQLRESFPDTNLKLSQLRDHVVIEGQARDTRQVAQVLATTRAFLDSIQTGKSVEAETDVLPDSRGASQSPNFPAAQNGENAATGADLGRSSGKPDFEATLIPSQIINLIRVPGPQQVMLKVTVAELNRTALRRLGTGWLAQDGNYAIGSSPGPPLPLQPQGVVGGGVGGGAGGGTLLDLIAPAAGSVTAFGVFDGGKTAFVIDALRQNQVLSILAEPTLVALHGEEATFLAGGQFPVPVPQPGGGQSLVTIQYKQFGVSLNFKPYILDDETIRLSVAPEVSSIDFSTGVVFNGTVVPGIQTRNASTVVELAQGQTLAIAGILQTQMDGTTRRIPFLGDLPYLGAMFRSNSHQKTEKELIVLVTPYLVESMKADEVPAVAGDCIQEPNDHEFYMQGRLESREPRPYRSTAAWDDPVGVSRIRKVKKSSGHATLSPN